MSKLLVLTSNKNDYPPKRIKEEAEKLGVETLLAQYHEVDMFFNDSGVKVVIGGRDLWEFNFLVLRGTGAGNFNFSVHRDAIVKLLWGDGRVRVLNHELFVKFPGSFDKLMQAVELKKAGLPVIPARVYGFFDRALEAETELPVIMKTFAGSHGSGVKKIVSRRGIEYFMGVMLPWKVMYQPFLRTGEDYRVMVLGGRVVGAMKRMAKKGGYLTNVSAGGLFEEALVTEELRGLALRAARVFAAEYCGVDVMYDLEGRAYVLEVNKAAEFKGFESCTGINLAGEMVKYLLGGGRE